MAYNNTKKGEENDVKPDYIAYAVSDVAEDDKKKGVKARWKQIGVVFDNKKGYVNVLLDALPVNGKMILKAYSLVESDREKFEQK